MSRSFDDLLPIANNVLLTLIILVNVYVIAAPLYPGLVFYWQRHAGRQQQLAQLVHDSRRHSATFPQPRASERPNSLVVPGVMLDQPIHEGAIRQQYDVLNKGVWRHPDSTTPDKGGNTVLVGHRFSYTTPRGVFYFLDRVKVGDEIAVFWKGSGYTYKVTSTAVVPPTDTSVVAPTTDSRLTLFTCTPLWSPKDRLVVVAELEQT